MLLKRSYSAKVSGGPKGINDVTAINFACHNLLHSEFGECMEKFIPIRLPNDEMCQTYVGSITIQNSEIHINSETAGLQRQQNDVFCFRLYREVS